MNSAEKQVVTDFLDEYPELFVTHWQQGQELSDKEWETVSDKWVDEMPLNWTYQMAEEVEKQMKSHDWSQAIAKAADDLDTGELPVDDYDFYRDDEAFDAGRERRHQGDSGRRRYY